MVMLVGLNEAKAQLRQDQVVDDNEITQIIHGCSAACIAYLKWDLSDMDSDGDLQEDSEGVLEVADDIKLACKYLIGYFYRDRDGSDMDKWVHGYLPWPAVALLYPHRDPTLA